MKALNRTLSLFLVLAMIASLFVTFPAYATELTEEDVIAACTKIALFEDFETNDVTKNFTKSAGPTHTLTKSELNGDYALDLAYPTASGSANAYVVSNNQYAGLSVMEFTLNITKLTDHGKVILGKTLTEDGADSNLLYITQYGYTPTKWGISYGTNRSANDGNTPKVTLTNAKHGVALNTDIKVKTIATGTKVYVYINDVLAYTYTEADASTYVAAPGIATVVNYFHSGHIYIDDLKIMREPTADEIAIEEAEKACTKTVFNEDFETNDVTKNFTKSSGSSYTLTKSELNGDYALDLATPTASGNANAQVVCNSEFSGKSVSELTFNVTKLPDYGRIVLGKIGDNYLSISLYGYSPNVWGIMLGTSLGSATGSPTKTLSTSTYSLAANTDVEVKTIATGTAVYVYINDVLAYTYSEADASDFVLSPGIYSVVNYFHSGHIYLDDITIKQEPVEEDFYTVSIFNDGTSDGIDNIMTIDNWDIGTVGYTSTSIVDGMLVPGGSYSGATKYAATPKVTLPSNYVAEVTGRIGGAYHLDAAVRLKTVGDTSYYFISMIDGASFTNTYYGIVTSFTTDTDVQSSQINWVAGPVSLSGHHTESAEWKFVVIDDTIKVYKDDSILVSYTNEELSTGTSNFDPLIRHGDPGSTSGAVKLSSVNILRKATVDDAAEYTITGVPETGTVLTNAETKRITITAGTDNLANNIKNTISLKANGTEIKGVYIEPDSKTIAINVNKLTSNTDYTLTFTPGYKYGVTQKTYTFTTGTITPVTNVAEDATVTSNAEKTRWVYALDSSYDLTEVAVTGAAGATVKLTRDENLTAEKMTTLGTVTDGNTMEISGDKIGRYKYIVIESETAIETAPVVSAAKSDLGDDWLKQRTLNMANADMRFASFSDLHNLATTTNDTLNTVMSGFDAMSNDIDAMTLVGDIVYWNPDTTLDSDVAVTDGVVTGAEEGEDIDIMTNRYKVLSDALNTYGYNNKQNNKNDGKATIWAIGNHEYAEPYSNYTIREAKTDVIVNNCIGYYDTHQVVNGYHLIGAALSSGLQITAEKAQWILDEVEAAEAEDPTKPIFVFTHVKLPDMVYPDNKTYNGTNYWNTAGSVIAELKKHKQVIIISGHEHAIAQLPGNIGQDGLTQVMLGVTGGGNMGRNPGTVNANSTPIYPGSYNPQGLMFEVKDNVTYIYRIDLKDQAVIGEPWVIDAEGRVNEQLEDTYTKARYENATAPYFEEGAIDNVEISKSGTNLVVKFPQAKTESAAGDNYVKAYEIHVKYPRTNSDIVVTSDISDYYFLNEKTSMSETMSLTFAYPELLNSFDCNVEIYPVSTYHVYGEPLVKTVEAVNQDTGLTEEELAKAKPDADVMCLDFYEKGTTDCVNGVKPAVTDVISSLSYDEAYNTDKIRLLPLSNGKTYQYFGGTNYLTYTIDNAPENGYTLEASFNMPTAQKKQAKASASLAAVEHKLIGTDAHSLYVDESSNVVFKYTVDGTAKTIKCPVPTSAWFHATATLSGTEAKLYIDGRVVASATVSGTIDPFGTDVSLGNNAILSVLKARVYGRALSVGEVDKLMTEHNTVLTGDTADSQIKLLSLNAPVTTLSGSYEASSGSESVLTDGTLSGSIDTATVIYGSKSMDIKIDLGKEYDADTIVLYAAKHYINHRMELTVQASREEADSDKSLRTNLVTVPRTGPNSGYDVAGNPIYLTVPDGVGPVRYIYLSKTEVSGLNCFALILAEVQVFGRECDPVREARIADVDYTDTAVTAVTLKSTSATPGTTCTIVIATYDEEDNMISAEYVENITLNKDYKEQTIEITNSPDLTNADKAKVFVWTDLDNIEPVMDCCVIK